MESEPPKWLVAVLSMIVAIVIMAAIIFAFKVDMLSYLQGIYTEFSKFGSSLLSGKIKLF